MQSVNVLANPKIVNVGELYGNYSATTGEWKDGLASTLCVWQMPTRQRCQWICFDGPIDVVWIEHEHSSRRQSRTLSSKRRAHQLNDQTLRMLFGVDNVEMASPAPSAMAFESARTSLGMLSPVLAGFGDMLPDRRLKPY